MIVKKTYGSLVQAHLELIVVAPDLQCGIMGYRNGTLVDFAQRIHLLHILPIAATKNTWTCLEHLDVVKPELSSANVDADLPEYKLVSLSDDLPILAILISGQIVTTSNEVDVGGVECNIWSERDRAPKQVLHLCQFVKLSFECNIFDPLLALATLVKSPET